MTQTPLTISQLPDLGSVQGTDRLVLDRIGAAVTAGSFVVGQAYQIISAGNTSFTAIGAEENTVGAYFVATGVGTGTGTAGPINTGDAPVSALAALLGGDPAGTAADAVAAHAAAADPHPTYTTAAELASAIAGVSSQAQTVTIAVRNNTGSAIGKGVPVYVTGSSGTTVTIAPADASAEATAAETLGLTAASIPSNTDGTVVAVGLLDGLNTSALTEGQIVWLSEITGTLTTTRPTQPAHGVVCGYCVKQGSGTSGILYVKVDNGLELSELHDVLATGASAGQFLQLAADGLWKPRTFVPSDISTSTAAGRALLTAANAEAQRSALDLGSAALAATTDFVTPTALSSTLSSYLTIANGALAYQPLDGDLTAIAALTTTAYGRSALVLANAAAGRTWLDLGTAATAAAGDFATPSALSAGLAGKADVVDGKIPTSQIPAIALVQYLGQVGSQSAMLALRGQGGDWCIRTDQGVEWVIVANDGALLTDWVQMPTGTAGVNSINGQTGAVTLGTGDLGESGGNLFFTAARAIGAALTGFTAGAGTVAETDSILQAFQKVVGNIANRALAGLIGSSGLTMATNRMVGRSTAGVGAMEEITVTSPLQLASGAFSLSSIADAMIFKATNRGETGTASTNYDELPVAVTNGTFAITGIYFGCHIDSVGTGTATFNAYRRTAAGVKTSLLTANATLSAGASLVDATSLLTGSTGITAGTRVGFDILGFGGATGVFVVFQFTRTQV